MSESNRYEQNPAIAEAEAAALGRGMNTETQDGNRPPVQPEDPEHFLTCPDCGSQVRGRLGGPPAMPSSDTTIMACTNFGCWWEYVWTHRQTYIGADGSRPTYPYWRGHIRPWLKPH